MITLNNLIASRNDLPLFSPINCQINPSEILQIAGSNGSGKSTLLRIIAGIIEPGYGNFKNSSSSKLYIGHKNGLKPELTVQENLQLLAKIIGYTLSEKTINQILGQVNLQNKATVSVHELSAGQARKLALTQLLFNSATLWILDEPGTSLDSIGKEWLNKKIYDHCQNGGTVILATHDSFSNPHLTVKTTQAASALTLTTLKINKDKHKLHFDESKKYKNNYCSRLNQFISLLKYELLQAFRKTASWLTPLLFFAISISLFPLAIGPDNKLIHTLAPSILWVTILLSTLLSIDNLFRQDKESGWIDYILTNKCPLILPVLAKVSTHWLSQGIPLILLCPIFGAFLNMDQHEIITFSITLLLGTPILSMVGAIGAALLAGIRGQVILLPIIIMPLYIPVLIFATSCLKAATLSQPLSAYLAILAALLLTTFTFAPILTAAGIRAGNE